MKGAAPAAVYGTVFPGDFESPQTVKSPCDRPVINAGAACPGPGGGGRPSCNSGKDGSNQACLGGKCSDSGTDSSQCCAPLSCFKGKCTLVIGGARQPGKPPSDTLDFFWSPSRSAGCRSV